MNRRSEPDLQNNPIRAYKNYIGQFFTQMRNAQIQADVMWSRLLAEGYVEVAPGILRHPATGVEVHNG